MIDRICVTAFRANTSAELNIRSTAHAMPKTPLRRNFSGRGVVVRPYVWDT
jgi:hypothetical protein